MSRRAILLASIAAAAPVMAAIAPTAQASAPEPLRFSPPSQATITRTLWRYLSDGNAIVVTRRYDVTFVPVSEGFRIDGKLVDAEVDAPAELAVLAELERTRADNAFPITLDRTGRIVADAPATSSVQRASLRAGVERIADASAMSAARKREMMGQFEMVAAAGAQSPTPAELFIGTAGERHERRAVPLPGGEAGEIELAVKVQDLPQGGLAKSVEKVVTTRLAGTTRVSKEVWSVTPR